ncbi:protein translocase subunit SecD, partial [Mycolicibacterium fortuitum]
RGAGGGGGVGVTWGRAPALVIGVVFLGARPLVYLAYKSQQMAKPALNGLGAVQQIGRERREASHATAGRG